MDNFSEHLDKKRLDEIINEIIDLKYDKSKDNKLKIQKLQQEMLEIENRITYD